MAQRKSVNRITIINILSTVILQGISFLTAPVFSRILGTENYGIYAVFTTWVSIAYVVFGLQTSSTIPIAPGVFPEQDQPQYQSSTLFLSVIAYIGFSALVLLFLEPVSELLKLDKALCILMLVQGFGQMCVLYANGIFTNEFKAENNFKLSLANALGGVALSFLFFAVIPAKENHYARILGVTITCFALGVGMCVSIFKKGKTFYNKDYWKFCLPLAIPCVFHAISGTILNQSDRVMLQQMLGDSEVGIYSLAYSFSAIITTIYLALNNSWVPFFYDYARRNETDEMLRHAKNYIELFTVLSLGFVLLSQEVFHVFAGREFWGGGKFIPLFVISNFCTFLYSFAVNYEAFHQNSKIMAITTMSAAVVNIVLNYVLILFFGIIGAVAATLISHVLQFAVHYLSARFVIKTGVYPFRIHMFLPSIVAVTVVSIICYFIEDQFILIRWGLGAVLGVVELYRMYKRKAIF